MNASTTHTVVHETRLIIENTRDLPKFGVSNSPNSAEISERMWYLLWQLLETSP